MKLKILTIAHVLLLVVHFSPGQIHDFDSLVQNNVDFRHTAQIVADTFDFFNGTEPLRIALESDFRNLIKRKYQNEYQDAVFRIMYNDSVQVTRNIKLRPRGNMRKKTCQMPPIRLNFPKSDAYINQLKQFDKLKMVPGCKGGAIYQQYLLSEYYAYKIYNIITDYSFRVRLLEVNYIDKGNNMKEETNLAFIIESNEQLAERLGCIVIEPKGILDIRAHRQTLADFYLFQYLIGNTDWSLSNLHNVELIKSKDSVMVAPFVIPYDFDYAGIVNTTYAVPDELLGTKSVRERVYRGICLPGNELSEARRNVLSKKDRIYDLFKNDKWLSKGTKSSIQSYLDEFFEIAEPEKVFKRYIVENCR